MDNKQARNIVLKIIQRTERSMDAVERRVWTKLEKQAEKSRLRNEIQALQCAIVCLDDAT